MSGAFDDNGTPDDFTRRQAARHAAALPRARQLVRAAVHDRRNGDRLRRRQGAGTEDLDVPGWLARRAVARGREATSAASTTRAATRPAATPYPSDRGHRLRPRGRADRLRPVPDRHRRARRRRLAAGRACARASTTRRQRRHPRLPGDALHTRCRPDADEAISPTRGRPRASKAIYRAPVRTEPQATLCTAHVFQQIPGQNRIFMGWYSQGTQVVDFTENARRHDRLQGGGLVHPREREPVGLARLQGRSRTATARSPTGARPATSPRQRGPERDRRLQGHPARAAGAARSSGSASTAGARR